MPGCGELRSQLASVKYRYEKGLLLMQSKKEYKKVYGKSPDRADAFVLTFAAPDQQVWDEDDEDTDHTGRSTIGGY